MTRRWKHRPEGSNWGEFGDDDQRMSPPISAMSRATMR
jgi:hypothetical protein